MITFMLPLSWLDLIDVFLRNQRWPHLDSWCSSGKQVSFWADRSEERVGLGGSGGAIFLRRVIDGGYWGWR